MIAVTGSTGQLGSLVIKNLLQDVPAAEIAALARSPEKAEELKSLGVSVREADYNRPETLEPALSGIEKLLLISSSEVGQREHQHKAVIDAAGTAGVKLIAYTSILNADNSPLALAGEHQATEALLGQSGIPYVLLRNGWYTENYAAGAPAAVALGALYGCAGEGRISSAARSDYAQAAAAVLTADDQAGKVYELAGDQSYTLGEFAREISDQCGKEIPYVNLSEADYRDALVKAELPEPLAAMLADSDTGASKGGLYSDSRDLSGLIGHETTHYSDVIRKLLQP